MRRKGGGGTQPMRVADQQERRGRQKGRAGQLRGGEWVCTSTLMDAQLTHLPAEASTAPPANLL